MKEEIKEILDKLNEDKDYDDYVDYKGSYFKPLLDYITNLQEENERLKKQNNDLRKIYRNTYQRLFDNGNDELARYFQAQIDDCPTFYIEPIIDYAKEWKDYKQRNEKAIEYIEERKKLNWYADGVFVYELLNILKGE